MVPGEEIGLCLSELLCGADRWKDQWRISDIRISSSAWHILTSSKYWIAAKAEVLATSKSPPTILQITMFSRRAIPSVNGLAALTEMIYDINT